MKNANSELTRSSIITLDIEASGIHQHSYPIEIGISFQNMDAWCSLIAPEKDWTHWDISAEAVHGISRQQLLLHGRSAKEIAQSLNHLIQGRTVYSDCWVLDEPWLIKLFEKAGLAKTFTLLDMMHIMQENDYDKLLETKKDIANEFNMQRHRATNDAKILQLAYERILSQKNTP